MIKEFEELLKFYTDNNEIESDNDEIESYLIKQANDYVATDVEQENILDDILSPSFGSNKSVEVVNRGGLRKVDIGFENNSFNTTQSEYLQIKNALSIFIKGESDESVDDAIDIISSFGDKSIKIVFNFARKFNFDDFYQREDLRILMKNLCLRSLEGRDTIVAVLMDANSNPHIKLAMLAAGEVKEKNAIKYICNKLNNDDLFELAFDALLDICDKDSLDDMFNAILKTKDDDEQRISYLLSVAEYFVDFGNDSIKKIIYYFNTCSPWLRPIFAKILLSFKEDSISFILNAMENERNTKNIEGLCRILGKLNCDKTSDILIEKYKCGNNKKSCIIGLGNTRSYKSVELFKEILRKGKEESSILEEVIVSLSFIARNEDITECIQLIENYAKCEKDRLVIHANLALARMDYSDYLEKYMDNLTSSNKDIRNCASGLINRLKVYQITKILEKCLDLPESKVNLILISLTKRKVFEKECEEIFIKLLDKLSCLANIEIYKIIANTVNTKNEIIPIDVLYEKLDKSNSIHEKNIIKNILETKVKKNRGSIGYK